MWTLLRVAMLAVAFGAGTWTFGWWAVPVIALAWGVFARGSRGSAAAAAVGAAVGWAALLGFVALDGRVGVLLSRVAPVLSLPGVALVAVTLLFAALVAWTGSAVISAHEGLGS
jgi:hypothetical protein